MRIFHNRPLMLACVLFALCAVFGVNIYAPYRLLLAVLLAVLSLYLLVRACIHKAFGRKSLLMFLCALFACLALFSSYFYFNVKFEKYRSLHYADHEIEGFVTERMHESLFQTVLCTEITSIDGESCRVKAQLCCEYPSTLQKGDRFSITTQPIAPEQAEFVSDLSIFCSDGFLLCLRATEDNSYRVLPEKENTVRLSLSRLNLKLSYSLRNSIGGEAGDLAAALLLGNRNFMSEQTSLDFQRAGVTHLIAISGLHFTVLMGFVDRILHWLRVNKYIRVCVIPLFAFVYLALIGAPLSAWRAVLMLCGLYLGFLLHDEYDPLTILCLALAGILFVTPYAVYDPALWLSFLTAGSILIFIPPLTDALSDWYSKHRPPLRLYKLMRTFIVAVAVGVVANLAILLYMALLFGEISLASVPATLLLSIPTTLLLVCSAVLTCFPFLPLLPQICSLLGNLTVEVARLFSELSGILVPAVSVPVLICLSLFTVFLIFLAVGNLKSKLWAIPLPVLLTFTLTFAVCYARFAAVPPAVTLDGGRGEVRVYAEGGECVLFNGMSGNSSESYEIKLQTLQLNCTEIKDVVVLRYYNQETYFLYRLTSEIKVRNLHLPEPQNEREVHIAAVLADTAEYYGVTVIYDAEDWYPLDTMAQTK